MLARGRSRTPVRCAALALALGGAAARVHAEPDPCSLRATESPCFDADPVWLTSGPARFLTLPAPRSLDAHALSLLGGVSLAVKPVTLVAPSPHPDGRIVPVLDFTSTLTLSARYGLGRGVDVSAALPLVPYQSGTGAEGVTSQRGGSVRSMTLRDPRLGLSTLVLGRAPGSPLAVATRIELAVPLGEAGALAGAPGPTVAPGVGAELERGRFAVGLDLGLRLRQAVSFATVREGSEAVVSAGAAVSVLEKPMLAFTLEAFLRAPLVSPPIGAAGDRNLPAEWLASARYRPASSTRLGFELGAGSGLPLSRARPDRDSSAVLGVTAPRFRLLFALRYALDGGRP